MKKIKLYLHSHFDFFKECFVEGWSLIEDGAYREDFFILPDGFYIDLVDGDPAIIEREDGGDMIRDIITLNGRPYIATAGYNLALEMTTEKEPAQEITEIREKLEMKKVEFAAELGIPIRTLEDWESGNRVPPVYLVKLIKFWAENK